MKTVITFGSFDLFHVGHVSILRRAKLLGDRLVVGVSTSELSVRKKGSPTVIADEDRLRIVESIRYVDDVFFETSLELKREYIQWWKADILVMGDDWSGKFDYLLDECEVRYLSRTPMISTSMLREKLAGINVEL